MRTIADKYIDEGIAKGMVQGIQVGEAKGKAKGKAEGKAETITLVAKNLLAQNIDINTISIATGLSIAEINKL